jgi:hypothetical protein
LTEAGEGKAAVVEQDLASDVARLLIARQDRVGEDRSGCLPFEVEADSDPISPLAPVGIGRILQRNGKRLQPDRPVGVRLLAIERGPQALAPDFERLSARQLDLVVPDGDHGLTGPNQVGPVPGDTEVRVQTKPHVAPDRGVGVGEVEVPGLSPQRFRPGGVPALVRRTHGHAPPYPWRPPSRRW